MAQNPGIVAILSSKVAPYPAAHGSSPPRPSSPVSGQAVLGAAGASPRRPPLMVQFSDEAAMSFSSDTFVRGQARHFASSDDIFCMFLGTLHNLTQIRRRYGVASRHSSTSEAAVVIEVYKALRDRAPFPASQAMSEFEGPFAFVLYDNRDKTAMVAVDSQGYVPLFWGTAADGSAVVSDDVDVVRGACGSSFAPFPQGCFFTTASGLHSYEHPDRALRPVPHVDAQTGALCGMAFVVDHTCLAEAHSLGSGAYSSGSLGTPRGGGFFLVGSHQDLPAL